MLTRDVRVLLRFCARRILRRIGHPAQNLGSCAEFRKIYQMAQKMRKFCWLYRASVLIYQICPSVCRLSVRYVEVSDENGLTLLVLNNFFLYFLPSAEYIFIFDYLTAILYRRLLSTATACYSTHPLDVDFCRQPHSTPYVKVDISTKTVNTSTQFFSPYDSQIILILPALNIRHLHDIPTGSPPAGALNRGGV